MLVGEIEGGVSTNFARSGGLTRHETLNPFPIFDPEIGC